MPGDVVSRGNLGPRTEVAAVTRRLRGKETNKKIKKSGKLTLFMQRLFPGGLFGASRLFSWLWWTVSWTLCCTLPSAVKHNATRLHHSRVWGYRWPAVCLCSSPPGQLGPSIRTPPPPPLAWVWTATTLQGRLIWTFLCIFSSFPGFSGQSSLAFSCWGTFQSDHAALLSVLAFLPQVWSSPWGTFGEPLMAVNWNITDPAPRSTCSHRPLSICRWKELKPIIVFLEGRLHPWTLWHTFKESGHNVFSLIQWLWH